MRVAVLFTFKTPLSVICVGKCAYHLFRDIAGVGIYTTNAYNMYVFHLAFPYCSQYPDEQARVCTPSTLSSYSIRLSQSILSGV